MADGDPIQVRACAVRARSLPRQHDLAEVPVRLHAAVRVGHPGRRKDPVHHGRQGRRPRTLGEPTRRMPGQIGLLLHAAGAQHGAHHRCPASHESPKVHLGPDPPGTPTTTCRPPTATAAWLRARYGAPTRSRITSAPCPPVASITDASQWLSPSSPSSSPIPAARASLDGVRDVPIVRAPALSASWRAACPPRCRPRGRAGCRDRRAARSSPAAIRLAGRRRSFPAATLLLAAPHPALPKHRVERRHVDLRNGPASCMAIRRAPAGPPSRPRPPSRRSRRPPRCPSRARRPATESPRPHACHDPGELQAQCVGGPGGGG